jgi:hypothetical protein
VNEVQRITITGTPTGGTFTLTFQGNTTAPIAYNASAATVVAALEALPGNVDRRRHRHGWRAPGVGGRHHVRRPVRRRQRRYA